MEGPSRSLSSSINEANVAAMTSMGNPLARFFGDTRSRMASHSRGTRSTNRNPAVYALGNNSWVNVHPVSAGYDER